MKGNDYYKELHAAARHYDFKIWTVIGALLAVLGWAILGIEWDRLFIKYTFKNGVILIFTGIVLFLLLLKFIKEHAYAIWIQKKINAFDQKLQDQSESNNLLWRQPLYSMPNESSKEFSETKMLLLLKKEFEKDPYFDSLWGEERLLRLQISKLFIKFIALLSFLSFVVGIFILYTTFK